VAWIFLDAAANPPDVREDPLAIVASLLPLHISRLAVDSSRKLVEGDYPAVGGAERPEEAELVAGHVQVSSGQVGTPGRAVESEVALFDPLSSADVGDGGVAPGVDRR
jgi:hypothetical protein